MNKSLFYILANFALIVFSSTLLSACRVPPMLWRSKPDFSYPSDQIPIEPMVKSINIIHPIAYPQGKVRELLGPQEAGSSEIPMDNFLSFEAHQGAINALVISRDGKSAISGGEDGRVSIHRVIHGSKEDLLLGIVNPNSVTAKTSISSRILLHGLKPILALGLSADDRFLAVAQYSSVIIFDLKEQEITNAMTQIGGRITAIAWDPRGEVLLMGRLDGAVYAWNLADGWDAGQDSVEALELYEGNGSPVVGLVFHPSGRVFVSAERNGIISLWRLLRSEREMGLRDDWAVIDQKVGGNERVIFPRKTSGIEGIWISPDGVSLFAAGSKGKVHRWKVRGASYEGSITVADGVIFGLSGFLHNLGSNFAANEKSLGQRNFNLGNSKLGVILATSSRAQRIRFWCPKFKTEGSANIQTEVINTPPPIITELEQAAEFNEDSDPVIETMIFDEAIHLVSSGRNSTLLWGAQKTGKLLVFNAETILTNPLWRNRILHCEL